MRHSFSLAGFALVVATLSACSDRAQEAAQDTGNAITADVGNAANDVANAADRFGEQAERAFDNAGQSADNVADATGTALENAGRDLRD